MSIVSSTFEVGDVSFLDKLKGVPMKRATEAYREVFIGIHPKDVIRVKLTSSPSPKPRDEAGATPLLVPPVWIGLKGLGRVGLHDRFNWINNYRWSRSRRDKAVHRLWGETFPAKWGLHDGSEITGVFVQNLSSITAQRMLTYIYSFSHKDLICVYTEDIEELRLLSLNL